MLDVKTRVPFQTDPATGQTSQQEPDPEGHLRGPGVDHQDHGVRRKYVFFFPLPRLSKSFPTKNDYMHACVFLLRCG